VRKILLLTIAGLASAYCSSWGVFARMSGGVGSSHTLLALLFCIFPALSLLTFFGYFLLPRVALAVAWLLPAGTYACNYLLALQDCARHSCTTSDSMRVALHLLTGNKILWLLAVVAFCLMLDFTSPASSTLAPAIHDSDLPE
jgi:hypothetical protein